MKNSNLLFLENNNDVDFINYLIKGNAESNAINKAVWDYVHDHFNNSLNFILEVKNTQESIDCILARQKNKNIIL